MPEDITSIILSQHEQFRRDFVSLWDLRPADDSTSLVDLWTGLADRLEVHAAAEERILYPVLLKRGGDDAEDETLDAIGDHNGIRDAIRDAAGQAVGTSKWWDSVEECRRANDDHLGEEERDVIPDFREHCSPELRWELGHKWRKFEADHPSAKAISGDDVDPHAYVEENE